MQLFKYLKTTRVTRYATVYLQTFLTAHAHLTSFYPVTLYY